MIWLTTMGSDGTPQPTPVWFLWDGDNLWISAFSETGNVQQSTWIAKTVRQALLDELMSLRTIEVVSPETSAKDTAALVVEAKKAGAELVSLATLCREADLISIHAPLLATTRGMIGAREMAQMKDRVILINCARGGIYDEAALVEALKNGRIAGVALDVFAKQPTIFHPLSRQMPSPSWKNVT